MEKPTKDRHPSLFLKFVNYGLKSFIILGPGAFRLPTVGIILYQLACPKNDVIMCLESGITNLSRATY